VSPTARHAVDVDAIDDDVRAQNTMSAIATQGVSTSRLEAEGYGEQHPVASNDTEEGRQRNRRVDVLVTAK